VKILRFKHGGIPCAFPHARVRRVASAPDGPSATLWPALPSEEATRWVEIDAKTGGAWISCSDLRVEELGAPQPLPALVSGLIGVAHVVGWARFDDEVVWLVDPARLELA